ncbi:MAG: hypothetical protein ABIR08_02780 [Sphingomonas sp.]
MSKISEPARQLYEAIVSRGYTSPDHTWEGTTILTVLLVRNGDSYDWLRELEASKKIVRINAPSFQSQPTFYAVPPEGYVVLHRPGPLTVLNQLQHMADPVEAKSSAQPEKQQQPISPSNDINWGKWGAIASIIAIPVAVLIWWLSK